MGFLFRKFRKRKQKQRSITYIYISQPSGDYKENIFDRLVQKKRLNKRIATISLQEELTNPQTDLDYSIKTETSEDISSISNMCISISNPAISFSNPSISETSSSSSISDDLVICESEFSKEELRNKYFEISRTILVIKVNASVANIKTWLENPDESSRERFNHSVIGFEEITIDKLSLRFD